MAKIYISSTYEDLKQYRKTVYEELRKMRQDVISMEDYVAQGQRPLQACSEDVASCDIYIGIFAWRYGCIPEDKKDNPNSLSITELEYRNANEKGIPCLIFLLDENKDWPLRFIDGTAQSGITSADNINRFRNELKNDQIASFFENPDQLASRVVSAVNKKLEEFKHTYNTKILTTTTTNTLTVASLLAQKPLTFKGEKSFFIGREDYINKIIIEKIQVPSYIVCIIGPGGSGKSQLAFKAIHRYEKAGLFDLVVPIYFSDVSRMTFSAFLLHIAKSLFDVNDIQVFEKMDVEQRKTVIYNFLSQRNCPLLFLDNYETVSYILNDERQVTTEQYDEAVNISNYLNNEIPDNISVLITSRERNNNFGAKEKRIDLEGLHEQESLELFSSLTSDDYLKNKENILNNPTAKEAIDKIFERTGGHPLSIEIIARNTSSIHQINQIANTLRVEKINSNEPEKRLRSLEACFDYTIRRLPKEIKKLLYNLTIFKSPFPIDVAEKVFDEYNNFVIELRDRSLLLEIKSETSFGEIKNPEYWLYNIHPAVRNYLEKTIEKAIGKSCHNLEEKYGIKFYEHYDNILYDIVYSIGQEKSIHRSSIARFNLIFNQGSENNDFDRSIKFADDNNDLWCCANIPRAIGRILDSFGILSKALEYHFKSLGFNQKREVKEAIAEDYKNIGNVYWNMGKYEQALEYYNKALENHTELNNREGLAEDYKNIGNVYRNMGNLQQALDYYEKALEIDKDLYDKVGLTRNYGNIGIVYYEMGNHAQALEYFHKAIQIYTVLKNGVGLTRNYGNIGIIYTEMGNHAQALDYHEKSLDIDTDLNNRVELARDHYNVSFPLYKMNKKEEVLEHLSTAKTILLDFEKETRYSHPLLKDVEDRITELKQDKK